MTEIPAREDRISVVKALVELSRADLLYSDEYLFRAESLLGEILARQDYAALCRDQDELARVTAQLRQAAEKEDWERVRGLGELGAGMRERVAARAGVLPLADAVYGPRIVHADGATLGMNGVVSQPAANLARLRSTSLAQLELLTRQDPESGSFYRSRIRHFEGLEFDTGGGASPRVDPKELREQILEAADQGSFDRIRRLTNALPEKGSSASGRFRATSPQEDQIRSLEAPFPDKPLATASGLGLAAELLPASPALNGYLSCCCAERAKLSDQPLGETERDPSECTCGHPCPPEVTARLRENLDFLLGHPFITSAGNRYLPWFGSETCLVETFPENDPDARTPLLDELQISRRHGVSRVVIENALLTHGPRLIRQIGLDPVEFQLVCIPFDAYLRLASKYGWGQRELWTHFDGYQITRELQLWSLVGGHARFGGPEDMSSLSREYESDRLTARFAILRRRRFLAREGAESSGKQ